MLSFGSGIRRRALAGMVMAVAVLCSAMPAAAQIGGSRYAAIVVGAEDGAVLYQANADAQRHPASLTKMMTLYMVFDALEAGRIGLQTALPVSSWAASRPPSRLGLIPGMTITVEQAIFALVTKSANDAAAAVGEYLGGSEAAFGQMMTQRARTMGMTRTVFRNASGLPDSAQVTTARDMVTLGLRLISDHPERYRYFSTPAFVYRGATLGNHNRLLGEYDGTDGIKTGYVDASGFNLVASSRRGGVRLVAAVFGGATGRERDRHMMTLLDQGFAQVGVAPARTALVATLPRPVPLVRSAAAATVRTVAAARRGAGRTAVTRGSRVVTATAAPRRSPIVVEQGDGGTRVVPRAARAARGANPAKGRPVASTSRSVRPTTVAPSRRTTAVPNRRDRRG